MADTKLTALTALSALANGDILYVVDDPAGTPLSRKVTVDVLATYLETAMSMSDMATGTLPIGRGGTGATSFTSGRFPYYDGSTLTTGMWYQSASKIAFGSTTVNAQVNIGDGTSTYRNALLLNSDAPRLYFNTADTFMNWKMSANDAAASTLDWSSGGTDTNATDDTFTVVVRMTANGLSVGAVSSPTGGGLPVLTIGQTSGNPTSIASNTAGLTAKDSAGTCELYAWDEAGNVTLLSPHHDLDDAEKHGIKIENNDLAPSVKHTFNIYTGVHVYTYTGPSGHTQVVQIQGEPEDNWEANQDRQESLYQEQVVAWLKNCRELEAWDKANAAHFEWECANHESRGDEPPLGERPEAISEPKKFIRKPQPRWR